MRKFQEKMERIGGKASFEEIMSENFSNTKEKVRF